MRMRLKLPESNDNIFRYVSKEALIFQDLLATLFGAVGECKGSSVPNKSVEDTVKFDSVCAFCQLKGVETRDLHGSTDTYQLVGCLLTHF